MIAANELRIGNWVDAKDTHHADWGQIGEIDSYSVGIIREGQLSRNGVPLSQLNPILLTPEILIACGFHCQDHRWVIEGNFFLEIHEHGQWMNDNPIGDIKYMAYKSYIGAITEIKTLHHLQNLYYSIFGTELNYTPIK